MQTQMRSDTLVPRFSYWWTRPPSWLPYAGIAPSIPVRLAEAAGAPNGGDIGMGVVHSVFESTFHPVLGG